MSTRYTHSLTQQTFRERKMASVDRWIRCLAIAAVLSLLLSSCASFDNRVRVAQKEIEDSFKELGYTTGDVIEFTSTHRELKGRKWFERDVRFRDRGDREPAAIHQYFAHDAPYDFDYDLRVGESESVVQKIRWYEFKLDEIFTIYRIEFVGRPQPQPGM
jgi:hypothetical protein